MPASYLPAWLSSLLRLETFHLLPFQTLSLARSISMSMNVFISLLAPSSASEPSSSKGELKPQTQRQIAQLLQLSQSNDMETTDMLRLELAAFKGDKESVDRLRKGMKEGIVMTSVKASPQVQEAVKSVGERKRIGSGSRA